MHNKSRPSYNYAADRNFTRAVLNSVTEAVSRDLYQDEVDGLLQYIQKGVDYDRYGNAPRDKVIDSVARTFVIRLHAQAAPEVIDTHEMLKQEIGTIADDGEHKEAFVPGRGSAAAPVVRLDDATAVFSASLDKYPRIAKQQIQTTYVLWDSKNRDLSTDWSTFKWGVMYGNSVAQGTTNTLADQLHNIVMMQFDRFYIPYVPTADNVYRRVSMFVRELANSAQIMANRNSFHILCESEPVLDRIELRPQHNDRGRLRFYTPINVLDSFTVQFYNPTELIKFMPDRYNITITAINALTSLLTFSEPHFVADGALVEISGFTTLAPAADHVVIDAVNTVYGLTVALVSDTTLSIAIDLTTAAVDPSHISKVFIAARRIFAPVRIDYMV